MAAGPRKLHSVAINLEAAQYLAGWRPEVGSLFLPTLSEARVGDEVAVRIGIFGQTIRATLLGTVGLVRRVGRPSLPPGVELTLDRASLPAGMFLAAASRGEKVTFRERAPRYVYSRPLRVIRDGKPFSDIVPLIGARRRDRLAEALRALDVALEPTDLRRVEAAVPPGAAAGDRYDAHQMAMLDSERR